MQKLKTTIETNSGLHLIGSFSSEFGKLIPFSKIKCVERFGCNQFVFDLEGIKSHQEYLT